MSQFDISPIVKKLESRYGLQLTGKWEDVEGGQFAVIRPKDLVRPTGFGIQITRTPNVVEANFLLDSFARGLLRAMSDSDNISQERFETVANQFVLEGGLINLVINGEVITNYKKLPYVEWESLELQCYIKSLKTKILTDALYEQFIKVTSTCFDLVLCLLPTEEIDENVIGYDFGLPEGAKIRVETNRYERNPINRAACISHYGLNCQVCGFDFNLNYGDLGLNYIEVHHLVPVSLMGGAYRINPLKDLVPVCGNCHAMLHRRIPPFSIEELKEIVLKNKSK